MSALPPPARWQPSLTQDKHARLAAQIDLCAGVACPIPSSACRIAGGCLPASGACAAGANVVDGTPCDDRDPTTEGDACVSGTCAGIFRWALTDYTTVVRTLLQLSSARNPLP